jgi:diadenylate cyclase
MSGTLGLELKDFFDILIVAFFIYQVLNIVRGTRASQMLVGVAALAFLSWVSINYNLHSLNWILDHFFSSFFIIVIVLFQDQIRVALASMGSGGIINYKSSHGVVLDIDEIAEVSGVLSREKIGALMIIESKNGLLNYMNTGTKLNSDIHSDLIYSIFQSNSPLHDGAIIFSSGKIAAAGCFLPLSKNVEIDRHMGTRHRAALGISEVSDAISIIISEETGNINICQTGMFYPIKNEKMLRRYLHHLSSGDDIQNLIDAPLLEEQRG